MTNKHDKVFTYSGLFSVGIIYAILLLIVTISFIFVHFDTSLFVGLLCTLTIICGLVALLIYLSSRHIKKVNNNTKGKLEKGELKSPKRGSF